jgi:hypothetical protein
MWSNRRIRKLCNEVVNYSFLHRETLVCANRVSLECWDMGHRREGNCMQHFSTRRRGHFRRPTNSWKDNRIFYNTGLYWRNRKGECELESSSLGLGRLVGYFEHRIESQCFIKGRQWFFFVNCATVEWPYWQESLYSISGQGNLYFCQYVRLTSDVQMVVNNGSEIKYKKAARPSLNSRYYPGICSERLREVRESLRILGVHAEIRIGNLPCTSQKRNRLSRRVG